MSFKREPTVRAHDDQVPTWSKDPAYLSQCLHLVRYVLQYLIQQDTVEGCLGEWERFGRSMEKCYGCATPHSFASLGYPLIQRINAYGTLHT